VLGQDSSVSKLMTGSVNGKMTYYADTGNGNCGLSNPVPPLYSDKLFFSRVAIVTQYYDSSKTCGACLNVTSKGTGAGNNPIPNGSFLVFVTDQCPSCASGGLDSTKGLDGVWDMEWTLVECPMTDTNYIQFFYQGSNSNYIKIQVRNSRVPAAQVYVTQGATELEGARTSDNFFEIHSQVPFTFPLPIRMVSILGDTIRDVVPKLLSDGVLDGTTQFPAHSDISKLVSSAPSLSLTSSLLVLFACVLVLLNM